MKYKVGDSMPDFSFTTLDGKTRAFSDFGREADKTLLILHRFYGCRMTQVDLKQFADACADFAAAGIRILAIVQSPEESVKQKLKAEYPFEIGCCPDGEIYDLLGAEMAANSDSMKGCDIDRKLAIAAQCGITSGEPEGKALQLPVTVLSDRTGKILKIEYYPSIDALPSPEDFLKAL